MEFYFLCNSACCDFSIDADSLSRLYFTLNAALFSCLFLPVFLLLLLLLLFFQVIGHYRGEKYG